MLPVDLFMSIFITRITKEKLSPDMEIFSHNLESLEKQITNNR